MQARHTSSVELTRAFLGRIRAVDTHVHAYLSVLSETALRQAHTADARLRAGESGALLGIPIALKDILSTAHQITTCGSKMLRTYAPEYNATVVERLEGAGAVILGKTNMDEFAMGSSTENSAYFPTHNPWNLQCVPGGSSGGSAAAVSAGLAPCALGTDTGGSIRQPAAFTGTVGLKPTYGRVSRYGLVAFASSLDQIGPLSRTVRDAAVVLNEIAGFDRRDATSSERKVPRYDQALTGDVSGLRIGVPREYYNEGTRAGVLSAVNAAAETLRGLGAELVDVSLPHTDHALAAYYVLSPAEAMANLARYDGVRYGPSVLGEDVWETFARTRAEGFGQEVKRRILLGTYVLSSGYYDAYYVKAQQVRAMVKADFDRVFESVDALLTPTTPGPAFRIGEKTNDPLQMYLSDVFTVPVNIAGTCGISVPCGFVDGLPVGLQLIGRPFDEEMILRIGDAFQRVTDFHLKIPPISEIPVNLA